MFSWAVASHMTNKKYFVGLKSDQSYFDFFMLSIDVKENIFPLHLLGILHVLLNFAC